MALQFPHCLIPSVRVGGLYTVFGLVEQNNKDHLVLNDGSGTIKVIGCPPSLTGYLEVRGSCDNVGVLTVKSFNLFTDEKFDLAEYVKMVRIINASPGDFASMTVTEN